ncbi:MAG: triose-phosphate isomerase, partial [Bacteroidetes bacterium]|nr:triose-phosphate isomerase [Bacteroidota bacterium]
IAGNWKMNLKYEEAKALAAAIREGEGTYRHEVILCPSFPYLTALVELLKGSKVALGAQNCADRENGAFTGEVSAPMLASIGVPYVIIGHSERRIYYHESHAMLKDKIDIALAHGLKPIFCCGETKEIRLDEQQENYVERQLEDSLFHLSEDDIQRVIIAYEPVWAIGTGLTATPQQAQDIHHFIRTHIAARYGLDIAERIIIQYGGSMKPDNAAELLSQPDVDGGLIGGASLKADDFKAIIAAV